MTRPTARGGNGWRPLAERYDALLVDLDGVVYRGDRPVPGAAEVLARLRADGRTLLFLTNNSTRSPGEVAERLGELGVQAAPEEVMTSAQATAAMLRVEGEGGKSAFVIGEDGLRRALAEIGIRILDDHPAAADLVVVGWDRHADYDSLRTAALLVQDGARLVATNADASYPAPDGRLWPGAGALLAAVTATTGAVPVVVGKPNRPMYETAAERTGARHPLVVGDRLDTDVAGGSAMGWDTLLVLTGASRPADLLRADEVPTYLGRGLDLLLRPVPRAGMRPASAGDAGALRELLRSCGLEEVGLEARVGSTWVCGEDPVLATACVEIVGGQGLLRSVAVHPSVRGLGLGMLITACAVRSARRSGLRRIFLLTQTAAPFFQSLGFRPVDRSELPADLRDHDHVVRECPATATVMLWEVQGPAGAGATRGRRP